jgi:phage-related protein
LATRYAAVPFPEFVPGLWEVRSALPGNREARVLFCPAEGQMVLLHGFMKKTQKTPAADLNLAVKRMKETQR